MSISVSKIVNLSQAALKFLVRDELEDEPVQEFKTIGGVFSNSDYAWFANGPGLEIVDTKTGSKVGAWTFGWVLRDSNTEVVCVDEIQRPHGRLPLLAVGVDCDLSGGMICIFDFISSKIIRAVHISDKITNLHVVDAGYDIFTLPGPLRNFDGVIAVGTARGDVFLVDICRQICDEARTAGEFRDELNPCQLSNITSRDINKIEFHKEFAIRNSHHLAIHLNIVFEKSKHFVLKGPKGDDRIHVNKDEVTVSALYYCPQLGSLLVGYNFGALQLYNLMTLELVYTSPVCDEHIPISHFAVQEPADDPRPVCYIWAMYSGSEQYPTCLPLAVMYAFCYNTKEYHEGYGFLYQDFSSAAVQYQTELGVSEGHNRLSKPRGGVCLKLNSIIQGSANKEGPPYDSSEDGLTLCVFVWSVWFSNMETDTFLAVFDLNQWYKQQMPNVPNPQFCPTYMIQIHLNDLINSATNKSLPIVDVHLDENSLQQFAGAQRLEEYFYPNSLSFGLTCLRENDVVFLHNKGVQKALLAQIESSGPLCLIEPAEVYQEIIGLGLIPLFLDLPVNTPISTNQQREVILGAALENRLMGWLCKCASEWANGSFLSTGCSLDFLINWAFQRAATLKTQCDNYCVPLFDYSQLRPDNNTNNLLNSCIRQLKHLCSLYTFVTTKLSMFVSNRDVIAEQFNSLQTVSVYFEVLQWLLNVGLLPECPITAYPRSDDLERINAPYPAEMLTEFYNHRRALLKILNEEKFSSSESVLFIDTLIERECGGKLLQEQWRNDGGNGLYPPPSLQALLRTYLVDNVDLSYKHLVVIYVFLDLAMTLDQERYKPVITYLIKFPAVFKVSPSVIKITQAFWQLDHCDYNTAMGLLLDPLISSKDLTHWHHKVALRSLMLQKQHNFALLYLQVRKPVLTDDDDVLTRISLYVSNNMLDEAFYFEKHFTDEVRRNKFLSHFFNECKKNDKLKSLIYRSLTLADENFFLKYLTNSNQSEAEDLHVYYHVLRSHFMEAFESHQRTVPNQIETQGLVGQENAIPRDKLVYNLKKLLPDVNRNLINLCHKERNNVWQQVSIPTPMSVFVHNLNENVQYKSTLIGAALAKAKQTFSETVSKKFRLDTEGTPFLRTPTVSVGSRRRAVVVVQPRVISVDQDEVDVLSPPSAKRLKLSPRRNTPLSASIPCRLETPIVKRKTPRVCEQERKTPTPHSILKVKKLINHTPSKTDVQFEDDFKEFEKLEYTPVSKKSGLGLSPRKSLSRASPVVRFEGLKSSSSSTLNNTLSLSDKLAESSTDSNALRVTSSSKNTSTEEEVFYSPESSLENKQEIAENEANEINEILDESVKEVEEITVEKSFQSPKREIEEVEKPHEERYSSPVFSPKARRSYKRSLTPIRFSPRLSKNAAVAKDTPVSPPKESVQIELNYSTPSAEENFDDVSNKKLVSTSEKISTGEESNLSPNETSKSSSVLPKLRPRKSLCRKVLETNALSRALSSPIDTPRSRRSKTSILEESTEKFVLESTLKYTDGEEMHKSSLIKKHNLTTSFAESDLDTSDDYSIQYHTSDQLKLSESMLHYLNHTNDSIVKNNSVVGDSDRKNDSSEVSQDKSLVLNCQSTFEKDKSLEHSVVDSGKDLPMSFSVTESELSESMMRCINNRESDEQDKTQDYDIEVMEVDDDLDQNEESKSVLVQQNKSDELFYETLTNVKEPEKSVDGSSICEKSKEKNETFDGETSSNRPVDPEMNVFEISDDLSYNDGLVVEKEVTLEEDFCYDQQNTLESVLEENISAVSSTTIGALEKNVLNESFSSEESNEEQGQEVYEDAENKAPDELPENEVIEIGSSSEDERNKEASVGSNSRTSSSSEESCEEKLEVSYERNIYDSDQDMSSESSYEKRYSELSENSSYEKYDQTKEGCGLFQGDIVLIDEEEDENNSEIKQIDEVEVAKKSVDEALKALEVAEAQLVEEKKSDVSVEKISEEKSEDSKEPELEVEVEDRNSDKENNPEEKDGDLSDEIEELNYEDQHGVIGEEEILGDKDSNRDDVGEGNLVENRKVEETHCQTEEEKKDDSEMLKSEICNEESEKEADLEAKNDQSKDETEENVANQDVLDVIHVAPVGVSTSSKIEVDLLDTIATNTQEKQKRSRPRSSSVSSSVSEKSNRGRKKANNEEVTLQRYVTRKALDSLDTLDVMNSPKVELDILDNLGTQPVRSLRPRRVSTEEISTPTVTLRQRSASVDEAKPTKTKQPAKKETKKEETDRPRRAASVSHLPKISEEDSDEQQNRSRSVLEGYSMSRRVTRRQMSLLKKSLDATGKGEKIELESMDPTVLLDKLPFEGKPDPEEQKVYETSPSTTNSASSTPVKPSRRLRSASQASETSQRSESDTPVKAVKGRPRKKSTDEVSNISTRSNSSRVKSKQAVQNAAEEVVVSEPRQTRSRARSISSVNSEDSSASETPKAAKRQRRVTSRSTLPEIKEEPNKTENSVIPKKRTRKNSTQT